MHEPDGPARVAAVAAWLQSLYGPSDTVPVLVGGGAVELYTGGAYRTGDLDFVGAVPAHVSRHLLASGFQHQGRHWIHEEYRLFIEFPARALDAGDARTSIEFGKATVIVIGLEEILVDRLAAWQFWRSEIDARNAWLLWRTSGAELDIERARLLAARKEVTRALEVLTRFGARYGNDEPTEADLDEFARSGLA
jgi:hypothetical protein